MNKDKFNIEDAFESDEDEKIRVYGATKQTPVKGPKNREKISSTSDEIPLTECQVSFAVQCSIHTFYMFDQHK